MHGSDGAGRVSASAVTGDDVRELRRLMASMNGGAQPGGDDTRRDDDYLSASAWRFAATLTRLRGAVGGSLHGLRLVDVGAYPGHLAALLGGTLGARVTAVTLMTDRAFEGRMREAGVAVAVCDVERDPLPVPAGTAHVVLCCELLEHLDGDIHYMLREIRRVLAGDGVLLLTTPNHASFRNRWALLRGRSVYPALDHPDYPFYAGAGVRNPMRHVREFTGDEIAGVLRQAGFTRVSVTTASPPPGSGAHLSWRGRLSTRLLDGAQRVIAGGGSLILATARP